MIRGDYIGHIVKYYTVAISGFIRFSEYVNRNILYRCMYCNDVCFISVMGNIHLSTDVLPFIIVQTSDVSI